MALTEQEQIRRDHLAAGRPVSDLVDAGDLRREADAAIDSDRALGAFMLSTVINQPSSISPSGPATVLEGSGTPLPWARSATPAAIT